MNAFGQGLQLRGRRKHCQPARSPAALISGLSLLLMLIAAPPVAAQPYGLIEIGAKGVKAFLFDFDRAENSPECWSSGEDSYLKCLNVQTLPAKDVSPIQPSQIAATGDAVKTLYDQMISEHQLTPERVYLVGSSSMEAAGHKEDVISAINAAVSPRHPIEFISSKQEATYVFKGVMGVLPEKWRRVREKQATVIDIGSGNIKASYLAGGDDRSITTAAINYGTTTSVAEIRALQGDLTFADAAMKWRQLILIPELHRNLDNYPGYGNANRIYLVGGISWAMTYLTHPTGKPPYTPVTARDIDTFLATASSPDGVPQLCSDERKATYKAIERICKIFGAENFIAGGNILKALSDELHVADHKKKVFFFDVLYAWDLGYLRDKLFPQQ